MWSTQEGRRYRGRIYAYTHTRARYRNYAIIYNRARASDATPSARIIGNCLVIECVCVCSALRGIFNAQQHWHERRVGR